MPKDGFDPQDPLELNGAVFLTQEDTTDTMCDCFIEEFMRMGHGPNQILALFRNPQYLGMNLVLQKRGEQFIRDSIAEVFARWGRSQEQSEVRKLKSKARQDLPASAAVREADTSATDPLGAPVPGLNLKHLSTH